MILKFEKSMFVLEMAGGGPLCPTEVEFNAVYKVRGTGVVPSTKLWVAES